VRAVRLITSHLLRNSFRFDHYQLGARFEVAAGKINRLRDVAGAFGLERLGGAGTTGAELDARSEVLASGNRTVAIA
jgi:hypothetical protein